MIGYQSVTKKGLRQLILKASPTWYDDAKKIMADLPATPKSSEFKAHWSKIKQVFMEIQHDKCCFCEKPLEGKIEQDVEHFRPKAEVRPWAVPPDLAAKGVTCRQPTDGKTEPGYRWLAYAPFNYAMACKTCNSTLKKNLFPIEGQRKPDATDPWQVGSEKPLLIYPIGGMDDPEKLIEFVGLSPRPVQPEATFEHRRALATISIFRLNDVKRRRGLYKLRATALRLLHDELQLRDAAALPQKRQKRQNMVDVMTADGGYFAGCMRSFIKLYQTDPKKAEEYADGCEAFMRTKSGGRAVVRRK